MEVNEAYNQLEKAKKQRQVLELKLLDVEQSLKIKYGRQILLLKAQYEKTLAQIQQQWNEETLVQTSNLMKEVYNVDQDIKYFESQLTEIEEPSEM